jgi:2-dehydropantoate 2-reductase
MRFHVVGVGAVGSLLAHHLRRAIPPTHSITLIRKTQRQARAYLNKGNVINVECDGVVSAAEGFRVETIDAMEMSPTAPVDQAGTIEALFVTTKAHQTLSTIHVLAPRLSKNSTIILLQNGMGVYEGLVHNVFRNPEQRPHFILASNTHGVFRKSFNHFVHAGQGAIEFGIVPDIAGRAFEAGFSDDIVQRLEREPRLSDITTPDDPSHERYKSLRSAVAAMLLLESLDTSWKAINDVQIAMRRKLVVNAVINPLTALMGCRNGDIFTTSASHRIMKRICQEASSVFMAQAKSDARTRLDTLVAQGIEAETIPVKRLPRGLIRDMLETEVLRVANTTKGNLSSMLQDIRSGRETEIDFINGYLSSLGVTYGVPMPANAMLLNLVKMRSAIPLDQML